MLVQPPPLKTSHYCNGSVVGEGGYDDVADHDTDHGMMISNKKVAGWD